MKRLLALFLVVFTAFACFACGGKKSRTPNVEYAIRVDSAVKSYTLGDPFSEPSMVSLIEKTDGKVSAQRILESSEYTVDSSAFNTAAVGDYEIVVAYAEKNVSVKYTVTVKQVSALSMSLEGQRLRFYEDDEFETGDLTVTLELEDGETKTLEATQYEVDASKFKKGKIGSYDITVTAAAYNAEETYTVYVKESAMPDYGTKISILGIGNSFTQDALYHTYTILRGYGFEQITLANLMQSNCDLEQHYNNIKKNTAAYEFELNTSGTWNTDPELKTVKYGLDYTEWDAIVIQQRSGLAGMPTTYGEYFEFLSSYVANYVAAKSTRIYWQITWAYETDSNHADFKNYANDQTTMYNAIVSMAKTLVAESPYIDGMIPTGTAVQNIRPLLNTGDKITRDGFHLNLNYGRYLAGATWSAVVTGKSPVSLVESGNQAIDKYIDEIRSSVAAAVNKPYEISDLTVAV